MNTPMPALAPKKILYLYPAIQLPEVPTLELTAMKRSIFFLLILLTGFMSLAFAENVYSPVSEPSRPVYTAPYTQNFNGSWPPTDWYAPDVSVEIGNTGFDMIKTKWGSSDPHFV